MKNGIQQYRPIAKRIISTETARLLVQQIKSLLCIVRINEGLTPDFQ